MKNHFFENRRQTLKRFKFLVSNCSYLKKFFEVCYKAKPNILSDWVLVSRVPNLVDESKYIFCEYKSNLETFRILESTTNLY